MQEPSVDEQAGDETESQSRERRKLYLVAKQIGLTRDERIELAQYLLRRDITSWKQLDEDQVLRLLDAIEGWSLIEQLASLRPSDPPGS